MKTLARWLPALATLALLVIALLAPVRRVGAGSGPVTEAVFNPSCDLLLEQNGSSATWSFTGTAGVTQPFTFTGNVAACSLGFDFPYYSGGVVRIRKWNASGLMADPTTVALRSVALDASHMQWSHVGVYFDPPVVLRESPDVAEGLGPDLALEFQNLYNPEVAHYDPDGPSSLPVARQFAGNPLAAQSALPGNHPVLDHRLCGGNSVLQDLMVTQSVVRADTVIGDGAAYEFAQHFRVPVTTRLHWIEFAMVTGASNYGDHGTIAVYEGNGEDQPPVALPAPLVSADFETPYDYYFSTLPAWRTHFDFDGVPTLRTDRDYWLVMRTFGKYSFEARRRTGSEGPAFAATMGSLLVRSTSVVPWVAMPNLTLDFRTIGEATYAVSVAPPHAAAGALRLAVAPSPARGPVTVSWSGARGALRFDVIDARGRRVGGGEVAADAGRWSWNGTGADGRALPAGVYFVRAHDVANTASQRVVLVR